jgi:hypothetical protein
MAHHFKIETRPHVNRDGSESESKKDYVVIHRGRGGRYEVGVFTSRSRAVDGIANERTRLIEQHKTNHPNDETVKRDS